MRIVRARAMGLCFGVRDALDAAFEEQNPTDVTVHGELVHNETVLGRLAERGFRQTPERSRDPVPPTAAVLITAHGVSDRERDRLLRAHKRLVDTTCPLVRKAHTAALELQADGCHVIVIGKPGHVEVRGLVGDLAHYDVVPGPEQVARYPYPRLGVVCQTTCTERLARAVLAEIRLLNPDAEIRFRDTICEPTKQRIRAVEELIAECDAVVVVGGANSNNTRQLARMCAGAGVPAHHVQGPDDIDPRWFDGSPVVGLTAGTSTLDETVDAVEQRLLHIAAEQEPGAA